MSLTGKKILFISVQTFGLEKEIKKKLEVLGAIVDYFDERPSNTILVKGIIRLNRNLYQSKIDQYYNQIIEKINLKKYQYLFLIKGEVIPEFFLKYFKKNNPNCITIFYTWDSFLNNKNSFDIIKYFDQKFTFDPDDAIRYGLKFRPLFYLDIFNEVTNTLNSEIIYDAIFLGTAHSDRYLISNKIFNWCQKNGLRTFYYYYLQSRLVFLYKKIFDPSFKVFQYKKLSFKSLNLVDIVHLYNKSNVIIDINHPNQKGLTMRTFESIGAKKKIVTTNSDIKRYSFYNPDNIYIINRDEPILTFSFFEKPYIPLSSDLMYKCSIDGWINSIFIQDDSQTWLRETI